MHQVASRSHRSQYMLIGENDELESWSPGWANACAVSGKLRDSGSLRSNQSNAWLPARLDMTPKNASWPATCTHYSTTVLVAEYDKNRDYKGSMMTRQVEASLSFADADYDVIRVAIKLTGKFDVSYLAGSYRVSLRFGTGFIGSIS